MDIIKAAKLVCKSQYTHFPRRSLDGLSFTVPEGQLLCVLGADGAGKTSLAHTLTGFLPLESGELQIAGIDVENSEQLCKLRKKCAIVFAGAEDMYISNSVHTELTFAAKNFDMEDAEIDALVSAALSLTGLENYENRPVPLLSSFERYCLAIAAAVVYEPEIIIFDSVAERFDEAGRSKVFEIIRKLHEMGKTVIYTSRKAQDAVMAERVLILKDGKLLGCDSPRKLISDAMLLNEAGIELPFAVRVYHDLLEAGAKLEKCPLDMDELVEEICK